MQASGASALQLPYRCAPNVNICTWPYLPVPHRAGKKEFNCLLRLSLGPPTLFLALSARF